MRVDDKARLARRGWLRLLAAAGALGTGGLGAWMSRSLAAGTLGATQGVNRLEGQATVAGREAKVGTPVRTGDRVVTARGSQAVIVIDDEAFLMRGDTTIDFKGSGGALKGMTIVTGKVLSVFSKKAVAIEAANASIGIRGTGAYLEVEPGRVYFCLCYGEAVIDGPKMPTRAVKTTHHESPLYLLDDGTTLRAEPGPFLNHSDAELVMLEALVGREPPFLRDGSYPSKKY
jgi:hypothetical protein